MAGAETRDWQVPGFAFDAPGRRRGTPPHQPNGLNLALLKLPVILSEAGGRV
jgi:hypothetical protein